VIYGVLFVLGIALLAHAGERYREQYGSPYEEVDKTSEHMV
jgi:hypothetical protein